MRLNLDVLLILDALDTHGSFATAAESLYKTPAALSYMIQKLESDLDITLLDRSGHRAKFTDTGRMVLEKGRLLINAAKDLEKQAVQLEAGWERDLAIALDASFPFERLLPLIDAFYAQNPQTRLNFTHHTLAGSWEELTRNGADIMLGAINEPPTSAEWSWKMVGALDNVFVVAPAHPLAEATQPLNNKQLSLHRAVVISDSARYCHPLNSNLLAEQPQIRVDDFASKVALLRAGWLRFFTSPYRAAVAGERRADRKAGPLLPRERSHLYRLAQRQRRPRPALVAGGDSPRPVPEPALLLTAEPDAGGNSRQAQHTIMQRAGALFHLPFANVQQRRILDNDFAGFAAVDGHQHAQLLIHASKYHHVLFGINHLAAAVSQCLIGFAQLRHPLIQSQQHGILQGGIPREGFTTEGIVVAIDAHFIAVVDAGDARPAKQPYDRQRQACDIFAQQRLKARGIVTVQLVKHPQLLLMRQPGAIVIHPGDAGLRVNLLRIVRDIGIGEESPQREGKTAVVHGGIFSVRLEPLAGVAKVLAEDKGFGLRLLRRRGNTGNMAQVVARPAAFTQHMHHVQPPAVDAVRRRSQ